MIAADLGRDASGQWKVISDRTQAPSGAGFAMQNRRVVSRVMPEIYHQAHLHRLTPFFQAMRLALVDAAPSTVEDPRVVVLSPGTHSETAFDQAFVASLLGFPLLEGSDLTVRDGRVWMRVLGKLEQVDVILRRVDSTWMDALELRPGSRLGVTGLLECVRQGTVSVVNNLGSGILENPALLPFLPELCERLLGQPLRLPSVDTWWCGDPASLDHVLGHLDSIVVRPISRGHGRSVRGAALTSAQRERLVARIKAAPHRFVGQEVLQPVLGADQRARSAGPPQRGAALVRGPQRGVVHRDARRPGPGDRRRRVVEPRAAGHRPRRRAGQGRLGGRQRARWRPPGSSPPRGRDGDEAALRRRRVGLGGDGAARAQRPVLVRPVRRAGRGPAAAGPGHPDASASRPTSTSPTGTRSRCCCRRSPTSAPRTRASSSPRASMMPEFRSLLLDRHRTGTAAQSLGALSMAAQGVRDQLSEDVWMVLADIDRALAALAANPYDQGLQLTDASERVLSGLLALAGIVSENMVRDPGWYMLDSGRGLERALQVLGAAPGRPSARRGRPTPNGW